MAHKVFVSYAPKDKSFREELDKHLITLQKQGIISAWHDGKIIPGTERHPQIIDHLNHADIILLLVSADYMSSDFCYSTELEQAIARHDAHEAHVIPILLRPTYWKGAPFAKLDMLPSEAKPVTDWPSHDKAFENVVEGIVKALSVAPTKPDPNTVDADTTPNTPETPPPHSTAFKLTPPKPLEFHIPGMGKYFLEPQDREDLLNIMDTLISEIPTVDGIRALLRGTLPDPLINRINYREASRNIAENILGILVPRGALNQYYHCLGSFLKNLLENTSVSISYDAHVRIIALLFRYTLITDRQYIEKLSAQFQVPSLMLTDEQLRNHPFSSSSLAKDPKLTENLRARIEALYNHRSYLQKVNSLIEGAKAASAVCRIDFDMRGEGTGFLVAPDLILTNYHVMVPPWYRGDINARAQKCEVKFGVIEGSSTGQHFKLHPTDWLCAESEPEDLDFILQRLDRSVTIVDQIAPLTLGQHPIQPDEFVNILQHPNGRSMEVSLRFNQVVRVNEKRIYYLADTEDGSSGSPVFDDQWRLVAIHHSGGELDQAGNLTIPANSGVPIKPIYEQIAGYLK
jgi:hypothetical protein